MTNPVKEIIESLNLGCSVNLGAREALRLHGHIAKIEQQLAAFTTLSQEANKVIDHIALAVGCEEDRMACWESVDAIINAASNAFGDGYYEGFVAGGKLQEDLDLNLKHESGLAKFCDHALEASEDAEASRANIAEPSQRKNQLAAHDAEVIANAFEKAQIPQSAKAGCIGEFDITVEGAKVCPACWNDGHDDECELCHGESDENGISDLVVTVPWTTTKDIWKAMNKFAAAELRAKAGAA